MTRKDKHLSETPATAWLRSHRIAFTEHPYDYVDKGGTSPFGLLKPMPIYVEASVRELPRIWINGGRRGFLVSLEPAVLAGPLGAHPVHCALAQ